MVTGDQYPAARRDLWNPLNIIQTAVGELIAKVLGVYSLLAE